MPTLTELLHQIRIREVLTDEEIDALRTVEANPKMLQSLLDMCDAGLDAPLRNVAARALIIAPKQSAGGETKGMTEKEVTLPVPLTLEELLKLLPEAQKAATTFEKSPVWSPNTSDAMLFRIKRIIKGGFDLPMVITSEHAEYKDGKVGPIQKGDLRLPTWAVARASERQPPVKFLEGLVYFVQKVGERDTGKINPFVQAVVLGPWPDFPK